MSFASYTPLVEVTLSNDKTIHVVIYNDSGMDLKCEYSVAWFTDISYRKETGRTNLAAGESVELAYKNKVTSHLARIRASAICE